LAQQAETIHLSVTQLEDRCLPSTVSGISEFLVPTAGSAPFAIAKGPDGNLWFTEFNGNQIGRVTPAGVVGQFGGLTAGAVPLGITLGPDGNLWFVEHAANQIGRITPSGRVSEFGGLTAGSLPLGITSGPDGNLWFTETVGNRIGRITPAGVVTEFGGLTPNSVPDRITSGPDGNLWFTEFAGNRIGRITPAGVVSEFAIPTAGSQPHAITAAPDGRLWFTEFATNRIGRISTDGAVTEFLLPNPNSEPHGITVGADGNIWFAEVSGNRLGRITGAGNITEFAVPTASSGPTEIVTGPDNNLWFTEQTANRIGKAILTNVKVIAVGADAGGAPVVNVYDAATGALQGSFFALPQSFTGGVRVAVGDVNGDGTPDIVAGAGPGASPQVTVFDGRTFQPIMSFFGLPASFTGGVFVAVGDVNNDGFGDIIVSADRGGGPQVTIFSGRDGSPVASFFATAPTFTGGIRVASSDINGDGFADVLAAAGPGGGPQVTIFNGRSLSLLTAFFALPLTFTGGVFIAAGDVNSDGKADIIVGSGSGGGPEVSIFNGMDQNPLGAFFALTPSFTGGVRVAASLTTTTGHASIVTAAGPGGGPLVNTYDGVTLQLLNGFFAFAPAFSGGAFVGG
jgi:streptogramin lyase